MKKLFLAVACAAPLLATQAQAAWTEIPVVNKTATTPEGIAELFGYAHDLMQDLEALNLASVAKLVVVSLRAKVVDYKWTNDATCALPPDSPLAIYRLTEAEAYYYYADNPGKRTNLGTATSLPQANPCR